MRNLCISLGHNSSAIVVTPDSVVGYEEERLNRIKSFSGFPAGAIDLALAGDEPEKIYISHWFDDFNFIRNGFADKHWTPSFFADRGWTDRIVTLTPEFTHHDAHAWSALAFFKQHFNGRTLGSRPMVFVCDGFGNQQEVFSAYDIITDDHGHMTLHKAHRQYGYANSLGLLYQHATAWCGMKENQDEYKFLGYESHILKQGLSDEKIHWIRGESQRKAELIVAGIGDRVETGYIDKIELMRVREANFKWFGEIWAKIGSGEPLANPRVVMGYAVQRVLEQAYALQLGTFKPTDVVVCGGTHFNVKLNHFIFEWIPGFFCAFPLAGDQGAAIGLQAINEGLDSIDLSHLYWGKRDLKRNSSIADNGLHSFDTEEAWVKFIVEKVNKDEPVNILQGAMEFGPRALCHTTTLAKPTAENTDLINALNGRNTVMPFAPVMTTQTALDVFEGHDRVIGSLQFMVTTLDWNEDVGAGALLGVKHPYPMNQHMFSGRPQIVSNTTPIARILDQTGKILINTSFNVHGMPIVYSLHHAVSDLDFNRRMAIKLEKPLTELAVLEN